jgi:D-glycero-D-manno-heptose 1,7-bisphosphate phosphatase
MIPAVRPAVFLDRDGTLIEDRGFLGDPAGVALLPTVVDALRLLAGHNYATIVISNQSGIARGLLDDARVRSVNAEIGRRLDGDGLAIDGWYWCPHYAEGCDCRKPEPGLLHRALREHALTLAGAAVVGDRGSDVELAQRVGIPGIAVPGPHPYVGPEPDLRANTLLEAAEWIVRRGH